MKSRISSASLTMLACAWPAIAQAPAAPAKTPAPTPGVHKIGGVTFQANLRSRIEMWDWFEGNANNSYAFSGNALRFSFSQTKKTVDWNLELMAPFLLALPDNAITVAPQLQHGVGGNYYAANKNSRNAATVFPKQGFVRFKGLFNTPGASLRLGRFEFNDGSEVMPQDATVAAIKRDRVIQRMVGGFGWTHMGRAFDGAQLLVTKLTLTFTSVWAAPTRGVFQVDGWGNLNATVGYTALTGQVKRPKSYGEWRLMNFFYQDRRDVLKTDNRPLGLRQGEFANITIGSYGAHYIHAAQTNAGTFDVLLWGLLQNGSWGNQTHRAGALDIEVGWQPKIMPKLKPWIQAGYYHGSGDKDPADGKHNTFFQMTPTPRPFARMPFFNMMNNEDFFLMHTLRPHKAVTLKAEYHALRLTTGRDLWYLGGGAFQPWTFGYIGRNASGARSLAGFYDLSADWTVNPQLQVNAFFGYAQGRAATRRIYPNGPSGSFGYVEAIYKF